MNATNEMTTIGTICHNDHKPADGVRVTLYRREADAYVWAAADGEEPYRTEVPLGREAEAWAGREWDLQLV